MRIIEKLRGVVVNTISRQENIFLAKKYFVELVYNAAYIEGCNVTFPETQAIIDGAVVKNLAVDDIQTVLNLRDGFREMLKSIDEPLTLDYICKINGFVSRNESLEWGKLRTGTVGISGTNYRPEIPKPEDIKKMVDDINKIPDKIDKSCEYFCQATKRQLFWDGNKRTSTIVANKILIQAGKGILSINKENSLEFNKSLLHYYNTGNGSQLKTCLKDSIRTFDKSKNIVSLSKLQADKGLER